MSGAFISWAPLKSHSLKSSAFLTYTSNMGCLNIANFLTSFDNLNISIGTLGFIKVSSVPSLISGDSFKVSSLALPENNLSTVLLSISTERLKLLLFVLIFIFSNDVRNDNLPVPYLPVLILFNFGDIESCALCGDPSSKNFSISSLSIPALSSMVTVP